MPVFSETDLGKNGWGIILSPDLDPQVLDALQPLLEWRQNQAGDFFHKFFLDPGETAARFISRNGAIPGYLDPRRFPYYFMLVGDPVQIPFQFQRNLGLTYAVGRLDLDAPQDYALYAENVLRAERFSPAPQLVFFAPSHPGDSHSELVTSGFIAPLVEDIQRLGRWEVSRFSGPDATRAKLQSLIEDSQPPALLVAAGHGLIVHPGQDADQGAFVCQDWPGPGSGAVMPEQVFAAQNLLADANLCGTIQFFLSAFSAGTEPQVRNPALAELIGQGTQVANTPFTSALGKRLLSNPGGPALGVVGILGPLWSYSSLLDSPGQRLVIFQDIFARLSVGDPLGSALEPVRLRYAELAIQLVELQTYDKIKSTNVNEQIALWTALQDAGSLVVLGDPAVRLNIASYENILAQKSAQALRKPSLSQTTAQMPVEVGLSVQVGVNTGMAALPGMLYPHLSKSDHSLFSVVVENSGSITEQIRLTVQIENISQIQKLTLTVAPSEKMVTNILPPAHLDWPDVYHPKLRPAAQIIIDIQDREVINQQFPVRVIDPDVFPLAVRDATSGEWHDFAPYLGLFIQPDDLGIQVLLAKYGEYKQQILQKSPETRDPTLQSVFELIRYMEGLRIFRANIARYLSDTITLRRVTTPQQTLASGQADGLQAAMLFASLLEAIQNHPEHRSTVRADVCVALLEQTALVGFNPARSVGWIYIDPILDENLDFKQNIAQTDQLVQKYKKMRPEPGAYPKFKQVSLQEARAQGIMPLPPLDP